MEELTFGGKKYVSSRRAARIVGYTKDYIGQLSRAGKIGARLVGRNWYIDEESLLEHRKHSHKSSDVESIGSKDVNIINKPISASSQPMELIYHGPENLPLNPELKKQEKNNDNQELEEYSIPINKEKDIEMVSLPHQEIEINEKDEFEPILSVTGDVYKSFLKNSVATTFILLGILTSLGSIIIEQVLFYDSDWLDEVNFLEEIEITASYRMHLANILELGNITKNLPFKD